jgi:DNA-binding NarL/FixJ family response regulator
MTRKQTRILIVEDHPIFRMGMSELINQEKDLEVCGSAEDVNGARSVIAALDPDMVIVDLSLKNSNGIELVKELSKKERKVQVLVLSMHDEALHAERCLLAGAMGYVMKHEASESVVHAIRRILGGDIYVSDRIMGNILNNYRNNPETVNRSPVHRLTDREIEIFELIGHGHSSGEIASRLNVSVKTIGTHKERIKQKLSLKHGCELVKFSVLWVETGFFDTTGQPADATG